MGVEVPPGSIIGGFFVESLLGRGAMGEVYRARAGDRVVALKLLDEELAENDRFRQRFLRETRVAERLHHPHIVPTLASGEDGGRLYLAMELIDGSDLREILRSEGRLEAERAVALIAQVGDALDAAHRVGLVHRDVKPGNILVDGERAYVCDFGLARHAASASSLTGDRGFVGTIDYVPPEQIEGSAIDGRADLYSLGCVLYECLTGLRPFERDSELSVVFAHLNEPPPRATDVNTDLRAAFDDVFAIALAKSPADRYSSCRELADASRAALRGEVVARREPRRRLLAATGAAVLVAAGVAAAAVVLLTRSHGRPLPVTIAETSIGGAKLGDSNITLQRLWSGGQKLSTQFPPDYSLLRQSNLALSAYFAGTVDRAVELISWNGDDRTDAGVGPCSTFAELKRAYGKRLLRASGNHGFGWRVGKHLFFALTAPSGGRVGAVAVYSDDYKRAGYNALSEGPCTGPAAATVTATAVASAPARAAPRLTQTFATRGFRPHLTVRAPAGWTVRISNDHAFALGSPYGSGDAGDQVAFFLDPYASSGSGPKHPGGVRLQGISRTPAGLVAWFRHNPWLVVTPPRTVRLGTPVLTAKTIDVDLSAKAPKEEPQCPTACISYLAFRGPGYEFPYGTARGAPARLFFTEIRIGSEVHTLAIAFDSASKRTFRQVLPAATAIVDSLRIDAVPVTELSPFGTFCTKVFGGTCLGELAAGTHSTSTFEPTLTYTVPVGWTNYGDHRGFVGFVPPGGDWQAVDANRSDFVDVFPRVAPPRTNCSDRPSPVRTVDGFVRWLQRNPALELRGLRPVSIGGLDGSVVDVRMRTDWKRPCPWSHGVPGLVVLVGVPPTPTRVAHNVTPQPMVMRLYLLHSKGGTLAIEIDDVRDDARLGVYDRVVHTFGFAQG